ncbi:MAG: hypothetical protein HQ472_05050 [Ignavibacteria bacterium]|nr:hypothetical protein [Ignavibacteria bacterium]
MKTGQLSTEWGTEATRVYIKQRRDDNGTIIPSYHRMGLQWGLYAARIPMAWEITMGSSDVRVLVADDATAPYNSNDEPVPSYGFTSGVGLNMDATHEVNTMGNLDGREDLVMNIHRLQTDGSYVTIEDEAQNSSQNGNIHVFEKFENERWVPDVGQNLNNQPNLSGNYIVRMSATDNHAVQCLSIMACASNGKGMVGIAPNCKYFISSLSKNPLSLDLDPSSPGLQLPHIYSASSEYAPFSMSQNAFPVVTPTHRGAFQFRKTVTSYDPLCLYKPSINFDKRMNVSAWQDTRTVVASTWNDGVVVNTTAVDGVDPDCASFDREINLFKSYFDNSPSTPKYSFWHQKPELQGTTATPSNVLYEASSSCGIAQDESEGCYRLKLLGNLNTPQAWAQHPDIVVPSSILCEGTGETYKQHLADQSYVLPFVNGVFALMRSVDVTGGVNLSTETLLATDIQISGCYNDYYSANPVLVNTRLQTENKIVWKNELHRRMRDVMTFTARKVPNPTYTYTTQIGDPMKRSWSYNYGYGLVDAYRCVAQSIPAKGQNIYGNNDQINFTNGTTINGKKYVLFGAWGRSAGSFENNKLLFDSPAFGFTPTGEDSHLSFGKTILGSNTYTVGIDNVLCIDGIVQFDYNGTITTTSNTNGRIMFSGFLQGSGSIVGNLTLGDVVFKSGTIQFSPTSNEECKVFGKVEFQNNAEPVFATTGVTRVYPAASILLQGSKDLVITNGAVLDLDYGCDIVAVAQGRKVIVGNGGKIRVKNNSRSVNIDADVLVQSGGEIEFISSAPFSSGIHVRSLKVEGTGKISVIGRASIDPVIGTTELPVVEIPAATAPATSVFMFPNVGNNHVDLSHAKLKLLENAAINLTQQDTLSLGGLEGSRNSTIRVDNQSILQLAAQPNAKFETEGRILVEGLNPQSKSEVNAIIFDGQCYEQPAVPRLVIKTVQNPFTGLTGNDPLAKVFTGFRAHNAKFSNVYVDLVNAPIINGFSNQTNDGFGEIAHSDFLMNRNQVKGLSGFVRDGAMLSVYYNLDLQAHPEINAQDVESRIRTVKISSCLFKDPDGKWNTFYYYRKPLENSSGEYLENFPEVSGIATTKLSHVKVQASKFAYLASGVSCISSGFNEFSSNTVVYSLTGFSDQLSTNQICLNRFGETRLGVNLKNSLFSRVYDNDFGKPLIASTEAFFEENAEFMGNAISHENSGNLLMRGNDIVNAKSGLRATNGTQILVDSKTRFFPTENYWIVRHEHEGRNDLDMDGTRVNDNPFLFKSFSSAVPRVNFSYDFDVTLYANLLVECGYNRIDKGSQYHLHRQLDESPDTRNVVKTVRVNNNEWISTSASNPAVEINAVRYEPGLFDIVGDILNVHDVTEPACSALVGGWEVHCPSYLYRDSDVDIRYYDGYRPNEFRIADLDTAIVWMNNINLGAEQRFDAVVAALEIVTILQDITYNILFEAACDSVIADTLLPCYVRMKALTAGIYSLDVSNRHQEAMARIDSLDVNGWPCSEIDTFSVTSLLDIVRSNVMHSYDSATSANIATMVTNATEVSRLQYFEEEEFGKRAGRQPQQTATVGSLRVSYSQVNALLVENIGKHNRTVQVQVVSVIGQLLSQQTFELLSNTSAFVNIEEYRGAVLLRVMSGYEQHTLPLLLP